MGFSFFSDLINPTKYDVPSAPNVDISNEQLANVSSNLTSFQGAKQLADQYDAFMAQQMQKRLAQTFPQFAGLQQQGADVISSRLKGVLSTSDLATSQRTSAARSLGLGIAGSPAGAALTLGDIAKLQYQSQNEGMSMLPGFAGTVGAITSAPKFNFSDVFMSPQQRISAQFQNAQNAWNVANLKSQMEAQPEPWMRAMAGLGDFAATAGLSTIFGGGFKAQPAQTQQSSGDLATDFEAAQNVGEGGGGY